MGHPRQGQPHTLPSDRHPLSALQAGAGGQGLVSEQPPLVTNGRHRTLVATTQAKHRGALTSTGRRPVSTRATICRGLSPPPPRQEADEGCWGSRQPGDSGGADVFTSEQGLRVGKAQAAWGFASDHRPGLNARGGAVQRPGPRATTEPLPVRCAPGAAPGGEPSTQDLPGTTPLTLSGAATGAAAPTKTPQALDRKPPQPKFRPYPSSADTSHSLLPRLLGVKARKPS